MSPDQRRVNADAPERSESLLLAPDDGRPWGEWLACVILVVTFALAGGYAGGLAGVVTVGIWFALGTPYALAAGVVFAVALTPDGIAGLSALLFGTGLLALLLAPMGTAPAPGAYAVSVLAVTLSLGGFTWLLVLTVPVWLAAAVAVGTLALLAYGLARYHLLQLGLLDEDGRRNREAPPQSDTDHS